MGLILVLLVIALVFAGIGFAVHLLWIAAVIFFVAWLVGLILGTGRRLEIPMTLEQPSGRPGLDQDPTVEDQVDLRSENTSVAGDGGVPPSGVERVAPTQIARAGRQLSPPSSSSSSWSSS